MWGRIDDDGLFVAEHDEGVQEKEGNINIMYEMCGRVHDNGLLL